MPPIKKYTKPAANPKAKKSSTKQIIKKKKRFNQHIYDLVNTSIEHKKSKKAISDVFVRKFVKHGITITNFNMDQNVDQQLAPLLRQFGESIPKLKVQYNNRCPQYYAKMENLILRHCRNTVNEIEFEACDQDAFQHINSSFPSVEKVTFTRCAMNKLVFDFNTWFPKARSLDLIEPNIGIRDDFKCIEKSFPRLDHLGIINPHRRMFYGRSVLLSFCEAIKLNAQLKSVRFEEDNDQNNVASIHTFLFLVNTYLPDLKHLDVSTSRFSQLNVNEPKVQFKKLKSLKITSNGNLNSFPAYCDQLKRLTLAGDFCRFELIGDIGPNEKIVSIDLVKCNCYDDSSDFSYVFSQMSVNSYT